jgi:hypothetical protein
MKVIFFVFAIIYLIVLTQADVRRHSASAMAAASGGAGSAGGGVPCPPGRVVNYETGFCEEIFFHNLRYRRRHRYTYTQPICRPGVDNTICVESGGGCASDYYCSLGRICVGHRCRWWP